MDEHDKKTKPTDDILVITHSFTTGPAQELRNFLGQECANFVFIEHPFPFHPDQNYSSATTFSRGQKIDHRRGIGFKGPDILIYVRDFFYTLFFVIALKKKYTTAIAADNLNALAAICLRSLGYIESVTFWTIDYSPRRFKNKLLNYIYHAIDRFCCQHADLLWNSSPRMKSAREKNGLNVSDIAPEIIVRDGCHFNAITRISDDQIDRFKLVFMGHLVKEKGVDLLLSAMPGALRKYPNITFTIIGTGPEEKNLKQRAIDLGISSSVTFTGFINDHSNVEQIIAHCGIAIAPYIPDPNNLSYLSDVGKVKIYLACGLPVLITDVPEIAREIDTARAGILFEYSVQSFTERLIYLLEDENRYLQYRHNAIEFARGLDWDDIFRPILLNTAHLK